MVAPPPLSSEVSVRGRGLRGTARGWWCAPAVWRPTPTLREAASPPPHAITGNGCRVRAKGAPAPGEEGLGKPLTGKRFNKTKLPKHMKLKKGKRSGDNRPFLKSTGWIFVEDENKFIRNKDDKKAANQFYSTVKT